MPRYFLEVAYKGTRYSGFQVQHNAITIQGEIEKAFTTLFPSLSDAQGNKELRLTGSSRTDAGVHAIQNFFHFDWPVGFDCKKVYNLNAILPSDIAIKNIYQVSDAAHCRFDAVARTYNYRIYQSKNPFLEDSAYFYPYPLDIEKLNAASALLKTYKDFTSFSKRHTQAKTALCDIQDSNWLVQDHMIIHTIKANRFLRGMVRALTATMLKVGRGSISMESFANLVEAKNSANTWFDAPAHGLFLMQVKF